MERMPLSNNSYLEQELEEGPERVSKALLNWRKASLEREKKEALLYLKFKGEDGKKTVNEIGALVDSCDERYDLKLLEAVCEAEYHRVLEKLLAAKKLADLRTAF